MDEVEFHREPPSNLPTMVVAFGGWIDAGEAATGAMRSLVRQLAADAARRDRPGGVLRLYPDPAGRAPERRGAAHHSLAAQRVLDLAAARGRRGAPPVSGYGAPAAVAHLRDALLDVAARCGVQRIVSLGAVLAAVPHTRPPRVTGHSTDPAWQARFEAWGMFAAPALRRPDRDCQRRRGRGAAPWHGVVHRAGASAPLSGGGDESRGEPGAADHRHPPARPGTGVVPPRCGRAGLSDPMRPGGGAGRRHPGLCAAIRAGL